MIIDFNSDLWTDPWFRRLSLKERFLYIYLNTNPHKNLAGLYPLGTDIMAFETGLKEKEVIDALKALNARVRYCSKTNVVFITDHVREQYYRNGKLSPKVQMGIYKNLIALSPHQLIENFMDEYPVFRENGENVPNRVSKGKR